MRITPIYSSNIYNQRYCIKSKPSFAAHPDFYNKYNSVMSCFFRRGSVALESRGYADNEKIFSTVFKSCKDTIKRMLIVGIGNSQEPYSYLASIKSILKEKTLKKNLDLHIIDLQSKPDEQNVWIHSFYDGAYEDGDKPGFALDSFVKDRKFKKEEVLDYNYDPLYYFINYFMEDKNFDIEKVFGDKPTPLCDFIKSYIQEKKSLEEEHLDYRVNDEILEFLKETYNNPEKSKWDSRVQETILDYPDNTFNIVSANNVLPYLLYNKEIAATIEQIKRTIKPKGYFITDPYEYSDGLKKLGVLNGLKEVFKGIYQKV